MYEEILSEVGFTKSEIGAYLALIELGSSTTGPIIKRAQIASGKAYLVLDKLVKKGLVTYTISAGMKYYQAKEPEKLLDYIKDKQKVLEEKEEKMKLLIENLKSRYNEKNKEPSTEIYQGVKGLKSFYGFVLKEAEQDKEVSIVGVPKEAMEEFNDFFVEWNKERLKRKIKIRLLYNQEAKDYAQKRKGLKYTEIRLMKKDLETPAWIVIFADYVATLNVHGGMVCFLIKDKVTAESYKKYFDILWKSSKSV